MRQMGSKAAELLINRIETSAGTEGPYELIRLKTKTVLHHTYRNRGQS
jgi:DNA-binding LacI/PurR family transcriptional regulator